jgi:hypothetical protein
VGVVFYGLAVELGKTTRRCVVSFTVHLPPEIMCWLNKVYFSGRTVTHKNQKRLRKVLLWIQSAFKVQCADWK